MLNLSVYQRVQMLAAEVISQSRTNLYLRLRFLGNTIYYLEPTNHPDIPSFTTDGTHYYYNSFYILKCFRGSSGRVARDYMHSLIHCIFRHFMISPAMDRDLWDLACDIAAENLIESLRSPLFSCPEITTQERPYLIDFSKAVPSMSAEKLYIFLSESDFELHDFEQLRDIFSRDHHDLWYASDDMQPSPHPSDAAAEEISANADSSQSKTAEKWADLAREISLSLQQERAQELAAFRKALKLDTHDSIDYSAFLQRFAAPHENLTTDLDSFDYILYTYGLSLYRNLPLIEPLEYKTTQHIRDFVIAIDTSGSISDQLVETFLKTTCSILQSTATQSSEISIYILQCDDQIRTTAHLKSKADIQAYIDHLSVQGRGETDFRPVFEHVDQLIESGTLSDMCGLLYFTDGDGIYPSYCPTYETAFIFPADSAPAPAAVPSWIIRVCLTDHDLLYET